MTSMLPLPLPLRAAAEPEPPGVRAGAAAGEARAGPAPAMDAIRLGAAFEREAPVLLAAARAITLDQTEAEDIVQATFEIALRRVHQLRDASALRSWLLTIQAREAFRTTRRLRRIVGLRGTVVEIPVAPVASADRLAVREALAGLPPRMRAAIVLHHMTGMTVPQVSAALGRSENTIRSQLKTGARRLREALGDD